MKKIFILSLLFISSTMIAQIGSRAPWMNNFENSTRSSTQPTFDEIVDAFNIYWSDKDETVKGSGYKPFKRWESLYQNYLNTDGTVMRPDQLWEAWRNSSTARASQADDSDWVNVGPLAHINTGSWSAGQGRVNAIAEDPTDPTVLYVGTPAGGIWKSTDSGSSWTPLSDKLPQIGVSGIAIDALNPDIIYIATGDDDAGDSYSVGVMKSVDGGLTWNTTGLNENNSPSSMNDIIIDPADSKVLWLATDQGVFKSIDAGVNWANVRSGNFQDLKIRPGSSEVLYAATPSIVYRSEDGGDSWTSVSGGVISGAARIVLDVTPANPDVLYAFVSDSSFGAGTIYKSEDGGTSFTQTYNGSPNVFESTQAWFDMAFAVSDTDEDEIYTGVLNVWKSTDAGANFTRLNQWNAPNSAAYTHADIHNLNVINGTLYCGSDGGIYSSVNGGANFTSLTEGLAIGQFYRIDVAASDPALITGGLQDNGGYARLNETWQNYYGADGMENVFNPTDPSTVYGLTQRGGGLYVSNSGGAALDASFGGPDNDGNWITPLAFSKDGRLYAGYRSIFEFDLCSNSWNSVSARFDQSIDYLETDPNNQDVMYIAINRVLSRSDDGGITFNTVNTFSSDITSIEVNNGNSEIVYIVTRGSNGRVLKGTVTSDSSSFEDITGSLPSIPKLVLKHQNYDDTNPLYLGTALGVWRYDDTTSDWEAFENNLPVTAVRDLDINENNGIITAGTYGRGIWQSAISAAPITTDVASTSLIPVSGQALNCSEPSTILEFTNRGTSAISAATVNYEAGDLSNSVSWTGSLAVGETASIELPALGLEGGLYTLTSQITIDGDQRGDNNEQRVALYVNESGEGDTINDFESTESELLIIPAGSGTNCASSETVWERGTPEGNVLGVATSGTNVYGTNLDGNHPDNVKEYLTTKCYDISTLEVPVISFNMAFELEFNWDILYMEYTTDEGETWEILGSSTDPDWYNSSTTPSNNCLNCPGAQWTGTNATMTNYSYDLSDFASETSMIFRFVFHADQSVNEEGVVIDDLEIGLAPLATEQVEIDGLSIYPNPSNGIYNIAWSEATPLTLEVFDILGKSIINTVQTATGDQSYRLDMSNVASGLYLLKINKGNRQITKKLILN